MEVGAQGRDSSNNNRLHPPTQVVRAKERLDEELRIKAQEDRERGQAPKT